MNLPRILSLLAVALLWTGIPRSMAEPVVPAKEALSSLVNKPLQKSEYETAEQYHERIARLRPRGELFLSVDRNLVDYNYNAETQILVVTAKANAFTNNSFMVGATSKIVGSGLMQNAFGATADVTHERCRFYSLVLQGKPPGKEVMWRTGDGRKTYGVSESLGIGLAFQLAPKLAQSRVKARDYTVVFGVQIGDLSSANKSRFGEAATLDSPTGVMMDSYDVPVFLEHLQIMYVPTHQIVASWPAKS